MIGGRLIPILQEGANPTQKFADIPATHPFFPYINLLKTRGITSGCSSTQYCPDRPITRGEFAVLVTRALLGDNFPASDPAIQRYLDVAPSSAFSRYINKLSELAVATGCGDGNFCPGDTISRSEAARLLVRARFGEAGRGPDSLAPSAPQYSTTAYFTDVPHDSSFSFVQKLRDLGVTSGCSVTQFCPDKAITRGEAAVFIVRALLTPVGD